MIVRRFSARIMAESQMDRFICAITNAWPSFEKVIVYIRIKRMTENRDRLSWGSQM